MWSPVSPASSPVPSPGTEGGRSSAHGATIFGKSLVIRGEVSGSEPLQIDGRVEGSIAFSGNHVSIGRDATVAADISAQEVVIRGTLRGNLTISDRVEIHGGGSVVGDIAARRINIEDGAHVRGTIDMRRPDPKAHLEGASSTRATNADTSH